MMRVRELGMKNFRGLPEWSCEFESGVNLFAGANGSGKSTVLDALSIMLSHALARLRREGAQGTPIRDADVRIGCSEACLSLSFVDGEKSIAYKAVGTRSGYARESKSDFEQLNAWASGFRQARTAGSPVHYPILAHYNVNRAVVQIPRRVRLSQVGEQLGGYEEALSGSGNFRRFFAWFRDQEDYERETREHLDSREYRDPALEAVRQAIRTLLPSFSHIHVRRRPHQAMCVEKNGSLLDVAQLSDGEKCALALVGDIACRMSCLCEGLGLSTEEILRTPGVVLIDELDLHLHPKWQRLAIRQLPLVFPSVQFIMSTHSPQMLGEVSPERVFLLPPRANYPLHPSHTLGLSSSEVLKFNMDETEERDAMTADIERRSLDAIGRGDLSAVEAQLERLKSRVPDYQNLPLYISLLSELEFLKLN